MINKFVFLKITYYENGNNSKGEKKKGKKILKILEGVEYGKLLCVLYINMQSTNAGKS